MNLKAKMDAISGLYPFAPEMNLMQILGPHEYSRVKNLLRSVTINKLFARSVVEGHVAGKAYVDDRSSPRVSYIAHPYGISTAFRIHRQPDIQ
jgi:hypothetical protein